MLHLHGGEFSTFYHDECGAIRRRFIRFVLEHVDVVVVLSPHWQHRIGRIAPRAKLAVVSNPVAPDAVAYSSVARRPDVLLFLGRFLARKGIFDLLNARG